LGRGLAALLNETPTDAPLVAEAAVEAASAGGPREVPIELIVRNPEQPRKVFAEAEIDELTASIREKGVLSPLLVRPAPTGEGWQLVAGERRWRASQRAGLKVVPVIVRELDDLEVLEIGIVENVQRADLNAIEEALAYKALMERFARTQDAIAQVVGKSRSHVANTLRLLQLPEEVRDHVLFGRLSAGHARAIATAEDPIGLAEKVIAGGLSVRQAEGLARSAGDRSKRGPAAQPSGQAGDADTRALAQELEETLGLQVVLRDSGKGSGELVIRYQTFEQLDGLCSRLSKPPTWDA
jgi:ParB family transcriptional regulator, chromosome partitioning protein